MIQKDILKRYLFFAPILALVIILSEIIVTNELAVYGDKLNELDAQIEVVTDDSLRLQQKIASASSIIVISSKAEEMGLVKANDFISVTSDEFPFALLPND